MVEFLVILGIVIIGFVIWKLHASYENKVSQVKDELLSSLSKFKELTDLICETQTDNKKIKSWDNQHKIDFVIINNKDKILKLLILHNEFIIWWKNNKQNIMNKAMDKANFIANNMILFSGTFKNRIATEVKSIISIYEPDKIMFKLQTFSIHSNTNHYNPNTKQWWSDSSPKAITFYKTLTPSEILERVEILAQFNFEMTEHQYNCANQRKLMTSELRAQIIERDNKICQICGKTCQNNEIEIDHIKPISKGGKTAPSNLQVLCVTCNRKKSNKWLEELSIKRPTIYKITEDSNKQESDLFIKKFNETKYNNLKSFDKCAQIGDMVKIQYLGEEECLTLLLVDSNKSSDNHCVSISAPIGQAIYGASVGDIIDVKTPEGIEKIKIIELKKLNN